VNEVEHKELTSRSDSPDPAEQGREELGVLRRVGNGQCGEPLDPRVVHNEVTPCAAGEWHRDGRGLWAMRRCQEHIKQRHIFGPWQYHVQPPSSERVEYGTWQPIETAEDEKDSDKPIIVFDPAYVGVIPAVWDHDEEHEGGACWRAADAMYDRLAPTHWMPLPPPPAQVSERAPVADAEIPEVCDPQATSSAYESSSSSSQQKEKEKEDK
jgi:hypothetical protein